MPMDERYLTKSPGWRCEVAAHEKARMFEIKMSQGAKPGKGGILPAAKVDEEIALIRGIPAHNKKLQRGLVSEQKSSRVTHHIKNMGYEVGLIAHSCGVRSPRELTRRHARAVQGDGTSKILVDIYPDVSEKTHDHS